MFNNYSQKFYCKTHPVYRLLRMKFSIGKWVEEIFSQEFFKKIYKVTPFYGGGRKNLKQSFIRWRGWWLYLLLPAAYRKE